MRSLLKLTLGVVLVIANVALHQLGALAPGALDVLLGLAFVVWHLGAVRVLLCGALFFVLAFAALPRGGCNRGNAYRAAMKSDLKNLASQQEIYYSDRYGYSASFEDLAYVTSDGVTVTVVASERGWSAVAAHAALEEGEGCAIYYGHAPRPTIGGATPAQPGEVACTG